MKRILLVVNPAAGKMQSRKKLYNIADPFCVAGYEVTIRPTTCRGDATRIARERGADFDLLVCCGGDGTLNETVTGLLQLDADKRPELGYIPTGSTNDFAATLGIPGEIDNAVRAIMQNHTRTVDVGTFNGRLFTYVAAFGAFSDASYSAPQPLKNKLGHSAYLLEGAKSIKNIRPIHMKIEAGDFCEEGDYIYGSISNTSSIGGLLKLSPDQFKLNDGEFELLLVKKPASMVEFAKTLKNVLSQNLSDPNVVFLKASEFKLTSDEVVPFALDGEYEKGAKEIEIKNHHDALTLRVGLTL